MTTSAEQAEEYEQSAYRALGRAYSHLEKKEKYQRRFNRLKDIRRPIEIKWKQVRDLLDPAASAFLDDDGTHGYNYETNGIIDDSRILDSTPRKMAQTAADGLHGGLTSPLIKWFSFYAGNYSVFNMSATHIEKEWLNTAEECVRDTLSNSNFYLAVHPFHKEIFEFGTSLLMAYSNPKTIVRFFHYTVGSFWLAQNSDREIDTVCTRTMVAAIDLARVYGMENMPLVVRNKIDEGEPDYRFTLIQMVQPWNFFGDAGSNPNDFAYEDIHFLEDGTDADTILYRHGFLTKPFIVGRWYEAWDSVYPKTCPGIDALPDIRQLYEATEQFNAAVEWAANPAWAVDATLQADVTSIKPGQIINVQGSSAREPVKPLIPNAFDLSGNLNKRATLIESISGTFYNHEIMMVSSRAQSNHVMTATEVDQLRQEKNAVMGPINTRQSNPNKEVLDRVYEIITTDWQILDEPPESLIGQAINPYFTSDMAVAQRQQWISRANDVIAWMQAVQNAYPQIRYTFNFDRWAREFEKTDTVPAFVFNSPEEVERLVAQENQAVAQQAEAQQMALMAKAGKDLGQTPTTGENAAAEVMSEMENAQV